MKRYSSVLLTALALAGAATTAVAQDGQPAQRPGGPAAPGAPGGRPRFVMPIMAALDKNGDGTLDAQEIAGASAALKTLDKNSDGKITPDELRPQRPDGGRGPGAPGGPPTAPPPANK